MKEMEVMSHVIIQIVASLILLCYLKTSERVIYIVFVATRVFSWAVSISSTGLPNWQDVSCLTVSTWKPRVSVWQLIFNISRGKRCDGQRHCSQQSETYGSLGSAFQSVHGINQRHIQADWSNS